MQSEKYVTRTLRGTVLSQNAAIQPLKKFCGRCRKELPADSRYLLYEECHKRVVMSEEDRGFYENSRLHY